MWRSVERLCRSVHEKGEPEIRHGPTWAQVLASITPESKEVLLHFSEALQHLEEGQSWTEASHTRSEWAKFSLSRGDTAQAAALLVPAVLLLKSAGLAAA